MTNSKWNSAAYERNTLSTCCFCALWLQIGPLCFKTFSVFFLHLEIHGVDNLQKTMCKCVYCGNSTLKECLVISWFAHFKLISTNNFSISNLIKSLVFVKWRSVMMFKKKSSDFEGKLNSASPLIKFPISLRIWNIPVLKKCIQLLHLWIGYRIGSTDWRGFLSENLQRTVHPSVFDFMSVIYSFIVCN